MEKMNSVRAAFCGAIGAAGGFLSSLFGGWSSDLTTLLIFMIVDFATGLIAAALGRSKKTDAGGLSSSVGWLGLAKKVMTLLLVLVAYRIDVTLGVDWVKTAVVIAFIVNETISIVENAGLIGVPMPAVLQRAIDLLKGRADVEDEET